MPIKEKDGNPLTTTEEQQLRWAEHFEQLLNRTAPNIPPNRPPAETELTMTSEEPRKTEILKAIKTLKNGNT
jgi:hypothetical protein